MDKIDIIVDITCREYGISKEQLVSKSRKWNLVRARQTALNISYYYFYETVTLTEYGSYIGRKHCDAIHLKKKAIEMIEAEDTIYDTPDYAKFREKYNTVMDKVEAIFSDEELTANYIERLEDIEFANLQLS